MTRHPWALLATSALLSCYAPPEVPPMASDPAIVELATRTSHDVDARRPTDLLPLDSGLTLVLDSYEDRILVYDGAWQLQDTLVDDGAWAQAARMSPARDGTVWLSDLRGAVVRIDTSGDVLEEVTLQAGSDDDDGGKALPWQPLDVLEDADALLVADRNGRLGRFDRGTGQLLAELAADGDDGPLGITTDLTPWGDRVLATDATKSVVRVLPLHQADAVSASFGRFGHWLGAMAKPKSAAPVPSASGDDDTLLVADSLLGVVQLFDAEGDPLGGLGSDGELLRIDHPIAIRATSDPGRFLVLDATTARVLDLTLAPDAVDQALATRGTRRLRTRLVDEADARPTRTCDQCHDGLIRDGRYVFDDALAHHPVNMVPERELPPFFQLSEDGELVCGTCHSPHGSTALDDVLATASQDETLDRSRHRAEDDTFLRVSRNEDGLCRACHGDTAHDDALGALGGAPQTGDSHAHPNGEALRKALRSRSDVDPEGVIDALAGSRCTTCHAPHGAAQEEGILRSPDDATLCLACHEVQEEAGQNHPLAAAEDRKGPHPRPGSALPLSRDGAVTCTSCHALVGGTGSALLRSPADGSRLCTSCHDEGRTLANGAHRKVQGRHGLACLGCHDVHGGDTDTHLLRTAAHGTPMDPLGCLDCHDRGHRASKPGIVPGSLGHPIADAATDDGKPLTCMRCHDNHVPVDEATRDCSTCHEEQSAAADRGGHGTAVCLDCHPAHATSPMARASTLDVNPRSAACLNCHGETTGRGQAPRIEEYEHPAPVFDLDGKRWTPLDGLQLYDAAGQPVAPGDNGDLTCATCHLTHGPEAEHPRDKLRRGGWQDACASCHGDDALPLYRYFHQPQRRAHLLQKETP